jgi:hypothetical protein
MKDFDIDAYGSEDERPNPQKNVTRIENHEHMRKQEFELEELNQKNDILLK